MHTQVHSEIEYSAAFLTSLSQTILTSPSPTSLSKDLAQGLHITPTKPTSGSSHARNTDTDTISLSSIPFSTLPSIPTPSLPLPLSDHRRTYASAIPGIKLTHPGGWIEGGSSIAKLGKDDLKIVLPNKAGSEDTVDSAIAASPSLSRSNGKRKLSMLLGGATDDADNVATTYAKYLASMISSMKAGSDQPVTPETFKVAVAEETENQLEELRKRMRAREEAVKKNEEIERKIQDMEMQRRVERRVEEGWRARGKV
jgi:hypothetical protein